MPFSGSSASRSVNVIGAYKVTLDPLPDVKKQGETVTFTGMVTRDGSPVPHTEVEIYRARERIAGGTTGSDGRFRIPWTIPYGLGCRMHAFRAHHPSSGAWSPWRGMSIAFPTKIADFSVPSQVVKGQPFKVSGKLMYARSSPSDLQPLPNMGVDIYVDNRLVKHVTTKSDGSFSAEITINTAGTHTVKAVFKGYGRGYAPAWAEALVGSPWGYVSLAAALVPLLIPAGAIIACEASKVR